jgi:N-acetylglutamate synthase-like GNAT family acetyltransferase
MRITVREARSGDGPAVNALYQALTNDPKVNVNSDRISQIASNQDAFLFVAEIQGQVVGTVFVSLCPDPMFGFQPFAVIENVVVGSNYWNRGVGTALMQQTETICIERDCSKIMLLSSASRHGAHTFFSRLGYAADWKIGFIKYRRQMQPLTQTTTLRSSRPQTVEAA